LLNTFKTCWTILLLYWINCIESEVTLNFCLIVSILNGKIL